MHGVGGIERGRLRKDVTTGAVSDDRAPSWAGIRAAPTSAGVSERGGAWVAPVSGAGRSGPAGVSIRLYICSLPATLNFELSNVQEPMNSEL